MEGINSTETKLSLNSQSWEENKELSKPEKALYFASIAAQSGIFLLGFLGNGLVIWLTGFKMKKTTPIVFYLNLAIADLLFAAVRPFSIIKDAMYSHWALGGGLCKLSKFVKYLNMFASLFMLILISVDRCLLICYPTWGGKHRTIKWSCSVSLLVWFVAVAFSLPYLFLAGTIPRGNLTVCTYNEAQSRRTNMMALYVVRFLTGFLVPFLVISVCYVTIAVKLKRKQSSFPTDRTVRIITAIIVLFFLCWMPYHVIGFLKYTKLSSVVKGGYRVASVLAYFSCCINPILYFFVGHSRGHQFCQSVTGAFRNALSENSLDSKKTETLEIE
nr:PREDICTED: N-formyl peptide receptor 2-like [Latimeria chalumnae]|eukprot:XP_005995746.1 PREDICTED: N-formyl peptide receptor 2-like [Latimeria chalumnae]